MLKRTVRTVQARCREQKWEHTRIERSYYFTEDQLQALINKGRRTPLSPQDKRARNKALRRQLEG